MVRVGRNDPCPCGSGKKYKKCCEMNKVVSIDHLYEQDMVELQMNLLSFAFSEYEHELEKMISFVREDLGIPEEIEELFFFHLTNWIIFTIPFHEGQTIFDKFSKRQKTTIKRSKLRADLERWTAITPSIVEVAEIVDEKTIIVNDFFTNEQKQIRFIEKELPTVFPGQLLLGILVPYGTDYTYFTAFIDIPMDYNESIVKRINAFAAEMDASTPSQFMFDYYPNILHIILIEALMDLAVSELPWETEKQKEVAELFSVELDQIGYPREMIQAGVVMWFQYCQKISPAIRNPNIYAASMHYLLQDIADVVIDLDPLSQKELAKIYGVSAQSISTRYRELDEVLDEEIDRFYDEIFDGDWGDDELDPEFEFLDEDEMDVRSNKVFQFPGSKGSTHLASERAMREMLREIEDQSFDSTEDLQNYLDQRLGSPNLKKAALSNRDQAQELLYDAYEEKGAKRKKLIQHALEIYPNSPDAYVLMADAVKSLEEKEQLYRQAVEAGEADLGQAYFNENKGHFWLESTSRPYMRAKLEYARTLWSLGRHDEAVAHYQDMLELNPNDNQGVRYVLLPALLELRKINEAKQLIRAYNDDATANFLFNGAFLEYLDNGLNAAFKKKLKQAVQQNPYVLAYLIGKKKLPKKQPEYIGFGDETEAIAYVQDHGHLWCDHQKLYEWLKEADGSLVSH